MTSVPDSGQALRQKPAGAWYTVVLGDPSVSQPGSAFPVPELGEACLCCDRPGAELTHFDPSTGASIATAIPMPLCAECRPHVRLDEKRVLYLVSAAFGGAFLAVFGFVNLLLTAIGVAVFAIAAAVLFFDRQRQRRLSESGHHAGLEIAAHPGVCSVRTMNLRVARRLVDRHQGGILRVK